MDTTLSSGDSFGVLECLSLIALDTSRDRLNYELSELLLDQKPDFVLLQEAIRFGSSANTQDGLLKPIPGYNHQYIEAINNRYQRTLKNGRDFTRSVGKKTGFLSQGCVILWRDDLSTGHIWNFDIHPFRARLIWTGTQT